PSPHCLAPSGGKRNPSGASRGAAASVVAAALARRVGEEWVSHHETVEPAEVAVGGPELADAMVATERRDARVVYLGPGDPTRPKDVAKLGPVRRSFAQQDETGRRHPGFDLSDRSFERRRGVKDSGVSHRAQELVEAGPRDRPGRSSLGQRRQVMLGRIVKRRVVAMRVDEDVRVDRDHSPPRPSSYAATRNRDHPPRAAKSGWSPRPPLKLASRRRNWR